MKTTKMILLALLIVMAGILNFIEAILPIPMPIPGFKLGLANIITLYVLWRFDLPDALLVSILRVLLGSLLGGILLSSGFFMSMAGAIISCVTMYLTQRFLKIFSIVGISVLGAVAHNIAQLSVAVLFIDSDAVWYYLPYLTLFALFTGTVTGLIVHQLTTHLDKYFTATHS